MVEPEIRLPGLIRLAVERPVAIGDFALIPCGHLGQFSTLHGFDGVTVGKEQVAAQFVPRDPRRPRHGPHRQTVLHGIVRRSPLVGVLFIGHDGRGLALKRFHGFRGELRRRDEFHDRAASRQRIGKPFALVRAVGVNALFQHADRDGQQPIFILAPVGDPLPVAECLHTSLQPVCGPDHFPTCATSRSWLRSTMPNATQRHWSGQPGCPSSGGSSHRKIFPFRT